jgi:XRE family transcriptional regulator, aerobic/anaerobic benzoate catabolism transcriptional regulator
MEKMLGERIRAARHRKGLTQQELADESGTSRVQIARVETGRGRMSIGSLRAVARVLGVGIDYLVGTFEESETLPAVA